MRVSYVFRHPYYFCGILAALDNHNISPLKIFVTYRGSDKAISPTFPVADCFRISEVGSGSLKICAAKMLLGTHESTLMTIFDGCDNARASYDFSSNDPYPYPRYTDDWFNRERRFEERTKAFTKLRQGYELQVFMPYFPSCNVTGKPRFMKSSSELTVCTYGVVSKSARNKRDTLFPYCPVKIASLRGCTAIYPGTSQRSTAHETKKCIGNWTSAKDKCERVREELWTKTFAWCAWVIMDGMLGDMLSRISVLRLSENVEWCGHYCVCVFVSPIMLSAADFFGWYICGSSIVIDFFRHGIGCTSDFFRHDADSTSDLFAWVTYSSSAISIATQADSAETSMCDKIFACSYNVRRHEEFGSALRNQTPPNTDTNQKQTNRTELSVDLVVTSMNHSAEDGIFPRIKHEFIIQAGMPEPNPKPGLEMVVQTQPITILKGEESGRRKLRLRMLTAARCFHQDFHEATATRLSQTPMKHEDMKRMHVYSKPEPCNAEHVREAFKTSNVPIYNVHDIEESIENSIKKACREEEEMEPRYVRSLWIDDGHVSERPTVLRSLYLGCCNFHHRRALQLRSWFLLLPTLRQANHLDLLVCHLHNLQWLIGVALAVRTLPPSLLHDDTKVISARILGFMFNEGLRFVKPSASQSFRLSPPSPLVVLDCVTALLACHSWYAWLAYLSTHVCLHASALVIGWFQMQRVPDACPRTTDFRYRGSSILIGPLSSDEGTQPITEENRQACGIGRLLTVQSWEPMRVTDVWSCAGKRETPVKIRRPTASSSTIPAFENPVTRTGIEPGSPCWEASRLTAQPPLGRYAWNGVFQFREEQGATSIQGRTYARGLPAGFAGLTGRLSELRRDVQGVLTSGLCVLCGLVRETSSARSEIQLLQPYGWYKGPSTPPALSFGNDERGLPAISPRQMLDSSVLCILEPQLRVHWLLPPHLAVMGFARILSGPVKYENAFSSRQRPMAIGKLELCAYGIEVYLGWKARANPASKAEKRGSDTGDTNTHAQCLIAPTRKACQCFHRDAVLCKLDPRLVTLTLNCYYWLKESFTSCHKYSQPSRDVSSTHITLECSLLQENYADFPAADHVVGLPTVLCFTEFPHPRAQRFIPLYVDVETFKNPFVSLLMANLKILVTLDQADTTNVECLSDIYALNWNAVCLQRITVPQVAARRAAGATCCSP
ncbi:hypothetical protein PR048_003596 [Dryococelus australis]|uniref:Uncharacterized protein n=1 Tax=Dryococelus australis TaxID=614101 RepID=A0ABQ9IPI3_9NEOP|nr:hypothetical protein PR048_003596 [Dryococelus australis]